MRGTFAERIVLVFRDGIIPAYAGNILERDEPTLLTEDHPRVCGEHSMCLEISKVIEGSSPRMRGTLSA